MSLDGESAATRAWIFQANPDRYEILKTLARYSVELWNLRQHAHAVQPGDRVYIWVAGDDAGIYAVGTVLTAPQIMPDTATGIGHWTDPREGRRPVARVEVRYDHLMLKRPLLKQYLEADSVLRNLTIIRSPRGTNFALTPEEAHLIDEWLAAPG